MSPTYVREKLHKVINEITIGRGDIVERLRSAGSPYLIILPEDSFPTNAKALWREVNRVFKEDVEQRNLTVEGATDIVNKLLEIQDQVRIASSKKLK